MKLTKGTLFIDMKYTILFRKLGFLETSPDIFEYTYRDTKIVIESENQRFIFEGEYYPLENYDQYTRLECLHRLLKLDFSAKNIRLISAGKFLNTQNELPQIIVNNESGKKVINIYCIEWGKRYSEFKEILKVSDCCNSLIYTSQLSGGIVEYKCEKTRDIPEDFMNDVSTKDQKDYIKPENIVAGEEFEMEGTTLIKYKGTDPDVNIPNGITNIGTGAFWSNTNVVQINIPESVIQISGDAFIYCSNLKKINIPSKVKVMGDNPFAGCPDLLITNESPYFKMINGVLFDEEMKTLIHYSPWKKETSYVIPETVGWIGKHSFYKSVYLEEVIVSKNVYYMGNNAFSDCSKIHLVNESPNFQYVNGVLYNKEGTQCMHYSMGSGVKCVELMEGLRTVGRNSFWNCSMIERLIIPESVREIGYNPFASCKNMVFENHSAAYKVEKGCLLDKEGKELKCCPAVAVKDGTINIPNTVINIGRNAFTGNDRLEYIEIPDSVNFISKRSFSNCSKLKKVSIPASVTEIGELCFNGCSTLEEITIPESLFTPEVLQGANPNVKVIFC